MGTTITVTTCDDGRDLAVRVGDTIEVHLPENAAGGYRWALDCADGDDRDNGPLEYGGTEWSYPSAAVGSAGEAVFTIRVRAAGDARLRLRYGRPWEGGAGVSKHFSVGVHASSVGGQT